MLSVLLSTTILLFAVAVDGSLFSNDTDIEEYTLNGSNGVSYPGLKLKYPSALVPNYTARVYNDFEGLAFLNIPYAVPLNSSTRFSLPAKLDNNTYKALVENRTHNLFGNVCPQLPATILFSPSVPISDFYMNISINCLNLNVFTPLPKNNTKLPVFVVLHGGGLKTGASMEMGVEGVLDNFISQDIIVVTANYRLGVWGFYNFNSSEPGHSMRGYYDQHLALEWVQDHIEEFGGDKDRVTLGGTSAGAMSATYHAYMAVAKPKQYKLFNQVISPSGPSTYEQWGAGVQRWDADDVVRQFFNCTNPATQDACIESISDTQLATVNPSVKNGYSFKLPDGEFNWQKLLVKKVLKRDCAPTLNLFMGVNKDEWLQNAYVFFTIPGPMGRNYSEQMLNVIADAFLTSAQRATIAVPLQNVMNNLLTGYFENGDPTLTDDVKNLVMYRDYAFAAPLVRDATVFDRLGSKVTLFQFGHKFNITATPVSGDLVSHGTDVNYLFKARYVWIYLINNQGNASFDSFIRNEVNVSSTIAREYVSFIKHGHTYTPNQRFDPERQNYLPIAFDVPPTYNQVVPENLYNLWNRFSILIHKARGDGDLTNGLKAFKN